MGILQARFWMRVAFATLLSSLMMITVLRAHEVQPTIADISIGAEQVELSLGWVLEAPVAGLNLEGIEDTNLTENAEEYDRLRALEPADLEAAFRATWPEIASQLTLESDGRLLELSIEEVNIPEVGDIELARPSQVVIRADLPPGEAGVIMSWPAAFGPIVIRQIGVENAYTAYLINGGESDLIARGGGDAETAGEAFVDYVGVGFDHIIPLGLDHILFVLGLFFLALRIGPLLWQITAFTLAHTVTLALGAMGIIQLTDGNLVVIESLIAASIVYVGIENIIARGLMPWRPVVVFMFGLLHGLGFASVLSDFGLGASNFVPKLIGFNVGVEIGQLAVIAAAFVAFGLLFGSQSWYRARIANPVSAGIAIIAAFWVLERTGTMDASGILSPFALLTEGGLPAVWTVVVTAGIAGILTIAVLAVSALDKLRDTIGGLSSFALFMAVVGTFTSGAFAMTAISVVIWILVIRLQSLGEMEGDTA